MSQNTTPAAPVPTDPARLQVDVRDGPPKVGGTPASAQPAETEERDHDPLASAAIMNVHPTKEGLNLITPAGGDDDPKFEMMKEAAGQDANDEKEGVGVKIKKEVAKAVHTVEKAIPGTKEHRENSVSS
ncbi:hypothetical protein ACKKBF_B15185 [Auxenochlorella protothecoides x Auxenochlorella symbiontica]